MNEHIFHPGIQLGAKPATTQAAEGLPRRCWSVAEIEAMIKAGIISEDERFEMIGGEIVPMSPKGARHEWIKMILNEYFQASKPAGLAIIPETTLRLGPSTFVEPDFCIFARNVSLDTLDGPHVLLAVEVADSSLAYDLGSKINIYAAHGVQEVWVINARNLVTRVHRKLTSAQYSEISEFNCTSTISASTVPDITLCLSDLGLEPLNNQD